MSPAKEKAKQDIRDVKEGEDIRMRKNKSLIWKIRGWVVLVEYWVIAFSFPLSLLIWATMGFWQGLAFWGIVQIYNTAGNIRGLTLHIESLIEYYMDKTV